MKRTFITILLGACGLMVMSPALEAQGRHPGARGNASRKESPAQMHPGQRPGVNGRPGANGRPPQHNQPGRPQPGRPHPGHPQPGGPQFGHPQPGHPQPGHPQPGRPQPGGPRPGSWGHVPAPPMQWHRPSRPPQWRPAPGLPSLGNILGLAMGSAFNYGLNALLGGAYNVVGYNNGVIALTGVPYFNFVWPEARMLYNNGLLYGSQFIYSTPYYDLNRYRSVYNALTATYGYPVSNVPVSGGMQTTWYSANGAFVTLNFKSGVGPNGQPAYYTILNLGL